LSIGRGEFTTLVVHRGWSHSLLVLPIVAFGVAWVARKWGMRQRTKPDIDPPPRPPGVERYWLWYHLCFWALITHPLLDTFTAYGTQLLAPLSDARFAIDGVSIIDPFYTIPMAVVVIIGLRA